jgi:spermidine synthase
MIPWELLGSAKVPGSGEELRLCRRGDEFSIRVNNRELMNSRAHGSEDSLAELACAKIADRPCPRVLIGGLGMGYTTAAALRRLGTGAQVVVAELVSEVVEWNRGPLAGLAGNPLRDTRVTVREADIAQILKAEHRAYDAILLDVDNGPEGLIMKVNDWLYSPDGLKAAYTALTRAGVLAIWSAGPDHAFTKRLKRAGFEVNEVSVPARGSGRGGRHTIWLAIRSN